MNPQENIDRLNSELIQLYEEEIKRLRNKVDTQMSLLGRAQEVLDLAIKRDQKNTRNRNRLLNALRVAEYDLVVAGSQHSIDRIANILESLE